MSNLGMSTTDAMQPLSLNPCMLEDERASGSIRLQITMKATTTQTGGSFNLIHLRCPSGYATSLHIHYAEDVGIYVLQGKLTAFLGEESRAVGAGSCFFTPRGTPHGFRVSSKSGARILCFTAPGGLDRYLRERELVADASELEVVAALYKIEILGPLPE